MLLFPMLENKQKVSVNLPDNDPRIVTARSIFPEGKHIVRKRIVLQGGSENTPLSECPTIKFNLSYIRHPTLKDQHCSLGYEISELMRHAFVPWSHGDTAPWLTEFAERCERIIRGEDEIYQLKRVEIDDKVILLRYSTGGVSGDVILEDFVGKILFTMPTDWTDDIQRNIVLEITQDEEGERITEVKSHLPSKICDAANIAQEPLKFYNYCTWIRLMLARNHETGHIELTRTYNLSSLGGNEKPMTITRLFHLLDGQALAASDGYYKIRL